MEKKTHPTVPGFEPGSFDFQSTALTSNGNRKIQARIPAQSDASFFRQKDLKFFKNRKITLAFQIQFEDELYILQILHGAQKITQNSKGLHVIVLGYKRLQRLLFTDPFSRDAIFHTFTKKKHDKK